MKKNLQATLVAVTPWLTLQKSRAAIKDFSETRKRKQTTTPRSLRLCVFARALFSIIFFLTVFPAFSQSAEEFDHLLTLEAVNYGQAAWLLLNAAGVQEITDPTRAFEYVTERNWLSGIGRDDNARLDVVSLLIMKIWELKGGIMYTITESPRYAYRELVYLGIIQGRAAPNMQVSGDLLLYITGSVLLQEETNE